MNQHSERINPLWGIVAAGAIGTLAAGAWLAAEVTSGDVAANRDQAIATFNQHTELRQQNIARLALGLQEAALPYKVSVSAIGSESLIATVTISHPTPAANCHKSYELLTDANDLPTLVNIKNTDPNSYADEAKQMIAGLHCG